MRAAICESGAIVPAGSVAYINPIDSSRSRIVLSSVQFGSSDSFEAESEVVNLCAIELAKRLGFALINEEPI